MAFNISAQIVLSGPKNLNTVANKIKKGLSGINIQIDPSAAKTLTTINTKVNTLNKNFLKLNQTIGQVNSSLNNLGTNFNQVNTGINNTINTQSSLNNQAKTTTQALKTQAGMVDHLNKRFSSAAKTAIAFGLISRPIYDLQRAFVGAIRGAVAFEKEIVKISQVTGDSVKNLGFLKDQINSLATSFGISANELAETATIIAQAGFNAKETSQALDALAKSKLTPTFGAITETTEGLIAALGQFNLTADQSEQILGSLNKVSKDFAVESADLIAAIRKSGGVFSQAAGGTKDTITALQELSAIFTAVRSTTRESADTIATGLRTIFSRIQRKGTINFLKQFGIDLVDAEGKFVGIFPAFDMLSKRLDILIKQGDALTVSAIAEELGGIRQIGKLLPAIAQFDKARKALVSAQEGAVAGLGGDISKALDTIDNRLARVQERFNELIRNVFESDAFQNFAKSILSSSENLLKFGNSLIDTFEPIFPLLSSLGTIKIAGSIGSFLGGGGIQKAASTVTGQVNAQAAQQNTVTTQQNTTILQQNTTAIQGNTTAIQQLTRIMIAVQNQSTKLQDRLNNVILTLDSSINRLNQVINTNTIAQNRFSGGFGPTSSRGPGGVGPKRKATGGKIYGFARGGLVPGEGNSDTVPAMLTPGEFVIRKDSVNKIGPETLAAMNENRKMAGSTGFGEKPLGRKELSRLLGIKSTDPRYKILGMQDEAGVGEKARIEATQEAINKGLYKPVSSDSDKNLGSIKIKPNAIGGFFLNPVGGSQDRNIKRIENIKGKNYNITGTIQGYYLGGDNNQEISNIVSEQTRNGLSDLVLNTARNIQSKKLIDVPPIDGNEKIFAKSMQNLLMSGGATDTIEGYMLEGIISALSGASLMGGTASFDYDPTSIASSRKNLKRIFNNENIDQLVKADAKRTASAGSWDDISRKLINDIKNGYFEGVTIDPPIKRASGSSGIGETDTVPALLTPGEFVINRDAAQRIGYGNLNRMNKQGVVGFNKGGTVGIQRFANGTSGQGVRVKLSGTVDEQTEQFKKALAELVKNLNNTSINVDKVAQKFKQELSKPGATGSVAAQSALTGTGLGVKKTPQSSDDKDKVEEKNEKLGQSFGELIGSVFLLQSAFDQYQASMEDGKLTLTELSNLLLVAIPAFTSFVPAINTAIVSLGKFSAGLRSGNFDTSQGFFSSGPGKFLAKNKMLLRAGTGLGLAAGGGLIGGMLGSSAGNAISDQFFGKQEEIAGFKGSKNTAIAEQRGQLTGALTGLGAGAGIGAGIGTMILPGIGTAIGAAIGGGAGVIIGSFVGAINGPLEQAAFEAAKSLKTSGEKVSRSIEDLEKQFSTEGFINLSKALDSQNINFKDAVEKFNTKFNDEITATSVTLNTLSAIPSIDAAFQGIDNLFGSTLSAANVARANNDKALTEAGKLIDPSQIEKSKAQLDNAITKFYEQFDFASLGLDRTTLSAEDASKALQQAAESGNDFAKSISQAAFDIESQVLQQRASALLSSGDENDRIVGRALSKITVKRNQDETFVEAYKRLITRQSIESQNPINDDQSIEAYNSEISTIKQSIFAEAKLRDQAVEQSKKESLERAIIASRLKQVDEEFINIIKSLKSPFEELSFTVNNANTAFDIMKNNIDAVFAGTGQFSVRTLQSGMMDATGAVAEQERERFLSSVDSIVGPGARVGIEESQRLKTEGPELIKNAVNKLRSETKPGESITAQVLIDNLEEAFRTQGFQLPSGLVGLLEEGSKREDEVNTLPVDLIKQLYETDQLVDRFGEVFEAAAQAPEKLIESFNNAIQLSEKRIALESELFNKQQVFLSNIEELNIASEKRRDEILSGSIKGRRSGRDTISESINRLNRRVATIAGTSNQRELLTRRGNALRRQVELQKELDASPGKALSDVVEKERISLANEINSTTEALKILGEETEVYSAILEKANVIGQNINALETGLEQIINSVASGDFGPVREAAIDQFAIDRAFRGIATIPQALRALQALTKEENKALIDAILDRPGAGADLRQNLLRQLSFSLVRGGGLTGQVTANYLKGILESEEQKDKLAKMAEERAKNQEENIKNTFEENKKQTQELKNINASLVSDTTIFNFAVSRFNEAVEKLIKIQPVIQAPAAPPAAQMAMGGIVYRNNGGAALDNIFKPKGTDTVPAMLTPGEFVVQKSAVDSYGSNTMHAINQGKATVYAADGAMIGNNSSSSNINDEELSLLYRQRSIIGQLQKLDQLGYLSATGTLNDRGAFEQGSSKLSATEVFQALKNAARAGGITGDALADDNMYNLLTRVLQLDDDNYNKAMKSLGSLNETYQILNTSEVANLMEGARSRAMKRTVAAPSQPSTALNLGSSGLRFLDELQGIGLADSITDTNTASANEAAILDFVSDMENINREGISLWQSVKIAQITKSAPRQLQKRIFGVKGQSNLARAAMAGSNFIRTNDGYIDINNPQVENILQDEELSKQEMLNRSVIDGTLGRDSRYTYRGLNQSNQIPSIEQIQSQFMIPSREGDQIPSRERNEETWEQEKARIVTEQNKRYQTAAYNARFNRMYNTVTGTIGTTFNSAINTMASNIPNIYDTIPNGRLAGEFMLLVQDLRERGLLTDGPTYPNSTTIEPPVAPPGAPPVASPGAPPVAPPGAPPIAPPVAPPGAPPVAPPGAPPVAAPIGTDIISGGEGVDLNNNKNYQRFLMDYNRAIVAGLQYRERFPKTEDKDNPGFKNALKYYQRYMPMKGILDSKDRIDQEIANQAMWLNIAKDAIIPTLKLPAPDTEKPEPTEIEKQLMDAADSRNNARKEKRNAENLARSNESSIRSEQYNDRRLKENELRRDVSNRREALNAENREQRRSASIAKYDEVRENRAREQAARLAQIQAEEENIRASFHTGGFINGRGDVPIMAQAGEYVMQKSAVAKYGVGTLERLNKGGLAKFHQGGPVYAAGGALMGKNTNTSSIGGAMSVDATAAGKLLSDSLITAGNSVAEQWRSVFTEFQKNLSVALQPLTTVPEKIDATLTGPLAVEVNGGNAVGQAIANQVIPMIEKVLGGFMKLIPNTNAAGEFTDIK